MAVVVETTLGDITIDLYTKERPRSCLNFLKLCKMKYYNYSLFHTVSRDFIAQTGDPTGSRRGGESIFGVLEGPLKRYFEAETQPRIKHTVTGLVSFVGAEDNMIGSQFFITLAPELTYLDDRHCVFGEVAEGLDVLELLNDAICDNDNRPYQDIRITHTVVLDDPYPDLKGLHIPSRSPSPSAERLQGGRIAPDEEIDETTGKDVQEIEEMKADREAKARATILEMVGDIPDAEMAPPENVLFVCKLNPVTTDDDLEIIFSRFGKINSCEVIRDRKTGDSLQYAFIEFDDKKACEDAYFKMDNVLIDDRRIHVDFSQSVAKVKWLGKGRGVAHFDDKGRKTEDKRNDIGQGNYKSVKNQEIEKEQKPRYRERSPRDKPKEVISRDRDRSRDRKRSRERRRSPKDRRPRSRDHERRDNRYVEERRNRDTYRSHHEYERRPYGRSGRYYEERRRSENYRKQGRNYKHEEKYLSKRKVSVSEESDSEEDNHRNRKADKKKQKSRSSSESSVDRKKSTTKSQRRKKSSETESSNEDDENYKKKKKSKSSKKKKKKYEDSSN